MKKNRPKNSAPSKPNKVENKEAENKEFSIEDCGNDNTVEDDAANGNALSQKEKKAEYANARTGHKDTCTTKSGKTDENERKLSFIQKFGKALAKGLFNDLETEIRSAKQKIQELEQLSESLQADIESKDGDMISLKADKIYLKEKLVRTEGSLNSLRANKDAQILTLSTAKMDLETQVEDLKLQIKGKDDSFNTIEAQIKKNSNSEFVSKLREKFGDIIKNDMTIDQALAVITLRIYELKGEAKQADAKAQSAANELIFKFKAELKKEKDEALNEANDIKKQAEEQTQEANRIKAEAEKREVEAEKRVNDIEASDKGQLTLRIENQDKQLEEAGETINKKQSKIDSLENDKSKLEGEKDSLQQQLGDQKDANKALKDEHAKELDQIRQDHDSKVRELKQNHKDEQESLRNKCKAEKEQLKNEYEGKIDNLKKDHAEHVESINSAHENAMLDAQAAFDEEKGNLEKKISARDVTISSLKADMSTEYSDLRAKSEYFAKQLFETLKSCDIMGACSDDYADKVEEKLQDVVVDSKKLMNQICEMSPVDKPSGWISALHKILIEQLNSNSSLVCRILKYYAMSNVPFMIDDKRESGICFKKKNITNAYEYLLMLLTQCGITPIIPSIFVENVNEGEYEVEGIFNDIEAFCPGSISNHIDHIERDGEGLDGVIIGVTKVGYKDADGKLVKAQVLVK